MRNVKKGDKIQVVYTGMLEDGTVFDTSTTHGCPLEFQVGEGKLLKGFDNAMIGMKIGEEKEIKLSPENAYGQHKSELVKELPKQCFPQDQEIQPGMFFMMEMDNGRNIPIRVLRVSDTTITIDLNHPLAGKTLIFKVKLVNIAE